MNTRQRARRTSSSTIAIGTASLFLAVAAVVSFLADDRVAIGSGWTLRGALIPAAEASAASR